VATKDDCVVFWGHDSGLGTFTSYAQTLAGTPTLIDSSVSAVLTVYGQAGTPNNGWILAVPIAGDLGFYNQSGLAVTFPGLTPNTATYAGRRGDHVYFRVQTAANQWQLIGSDGTNVDIRTGLPAGFAPGAGIGGHVWRKDVNNAFWVWGGTIPNPATPPDPATIPYVFHRPVTGATFREYTIPTSEVSPTVNTPTDSTAFRIQDLEDV
jgi:hypothetical protein